ncbi:MAG: type II secretion system protein [Candidatus Pacebacteria bacterium]|nr:type II secretion system protein [Candidatus Paceibacterota bacterium]
MNLKLVFSRRFVIKKRNAAFTLLELLVVIGIVGLLSSVALVLYNGVRIDSRNSERISDINQYVKAINLAISGNGEYPDPGDTGPHCLGDYDDDKCGFNGVSYSESSVLNSALSPYVDFKNYTGDQGIICGPSGAGGGPDICFQGYVYSCSFRPNNFCKSFFLLWYLEGENVSCGIGIPVPNSNGVGVTICQYLSN